MFVHVLGTRPNYVKAAPVIRALAERDEPQRIVHTGQHYDPILRDVFFEELDVPSPDASLACGGGPHGAQTACVMQAFEEDLSKTDARAVVVYGDVNSTLAAALVATKMGVPLVHVESGLRSGDRSMPEEINRLLVDRIADRLYTHSAEAVDNLVAEGVDAASVVFVGNTMIDTLDRLSVVAGERRPWEAMGLERGSFVLVTLHRPALVDDAQLLERTVTALGELARWRSVVFPVHPRTRERLRGMGLAIPEGVVLSEPLGYLDFLSLHAAAAAVLTDSGGVQEEAAVLGVPCFTLRDTTERPVTLDAGNRLLGLDPDAIASIPQLVASGPQSWDRPALWDGAAGERLADDLVAWAPHAPETLGSAT